MAYVWLVIALILGVVELCTTQLVSIWFAIGAAAAAVCSFTFLDGQIVWQIVVFIVVSAVSLILTKPVVKKLKNFKVTKTNSDRYVGMNGRVLEDIDLIKGTGLVLVDGKKWTAKGDTENIIPKDTYVIVKSIQGVKLIVSPCEDGEKE